MSYRTWERQNFHRPPFFIAWWRAAGAAIRSCGRQAVRLFSLRIQI